MASDRSYGITTGGAKIFVRDSGDGPVLLCLHAGVADSRMFERQHAVLSDRARVISFDRRGFGQTTTPDEPFSHVDDLATVTERCDVDKAVLVRCSQGGRIGDISVPVMLLCGDLDFQIHAGTGG